MQKQRLTKKQSTHQKILNIAYQLFYENGYDETSYGEIAKAAGVGYGTVYSHFPNKDAIIIEQTHRLMKQQITELRDTEQGERGHLEHAVYLANIAWNMVSLIPPRLISVYMAHRWTTDKYTYAIGNQVRDELMDIIQDCFIKAQENGELSQAVDIPLHIFIMDACYVKATQIGRFTDEDRIAAKIEFDKQIAYLLRIGET